ncbi:hypothetical protein HN747_04120 [archaeon]|jgi:hypothetical protein|nr:hypothetical protein [archaeon]
MEFCVKFNLKILSLVVIVFALLFIQSVMADSIGWGVCGDDVVQSFEQCDNGTSNGLGCAEEALWSLNYNESCNYCNNNCTIQSVQNEYCGDGFCDETYGEYYFNCPSDCLIEGVGVDIVDDADSLRWSVDKAYKEEHFLELGEYSGEFDLFSYPSYEEEGLAELILADGKCRDCERIGLINGIITENDVLVLESEFLFEDGRGAEDFTVEFFILEVDEYGEAPLERDSGHGWTTEPARRIFESGAVDYVDRVGEKHHYQETFIPRGRLSRGTRIRFVVRITNEISGEDAIIEVSDFVVSQYNLHMFGVNRPLDSDRLHVDYKNFNEMSEININIAHSAKYITHPDTLSFSGFGLWQRFRARRVGNLYQAARASGALRIYSNFGADGITDKMVLYSDNICSITADGCTNMFGQALSVKFSASYSVLSHELGHAYSALFDEYNLRTFTRQSNIRPPQSPVGLNGEIRFPACCQPSMECIGYGNANGNTESGYMWGFLEQSNEYSELNGVTIWVENESFCVENSERNCMTGTSAPNCLKIENSSSGDCGTIRMCAGMPYRDLQGNVPDDINDFVPVSHSVMSNQDGPWVYPDNSICPLKNCLEETDDA